MAFQLSPGVLVVEKDFTSIVPAVSTSVGAFAGAFVWGPVMDPTLITSENQLVARFGKPNDATARYFFSAANFLSYSNNMQVVRVDTAGQRNAVLTPSGSIQDVTVIDGGQDYSSNATIVIGAPNDPNGIQATASLVIQGGVITNVVMSNVGSGYSSAPQITINDENGVDFVGQVVLTTGGVKINNEAHYLDQYVNGRGIVGAFAAKCPGSLGNSIAVSVCDRLRYAAWPFRGEFDGAPGTSTYAQSVGGVDDELHIIVLDSLGLWTGEPGAILEKFAYVSKASDARKGDGANNYYRDVINLNSRYLWWMDHPVSGTNWGQLAQSRTFAALSASDPLSTNASGVSLSGGVDDFNVTNGDLIDGFDIFSNSEIYDISLIITGPASVTVAKHVVEEVIEGGTADNPIGRRDCVAFISPYDLTASGDILNAVPAANGNNQEPIRGNDAEERIVEYRTDQVGLNISTSYAVLDSGYKYQYDRYNDVYRWIPLNGDIAGLCARTDYTNDPWWSPGGLNRGQIKNVVKLAFNPNKAERDNMYKNGINPIVSFPGQGIVLFGDKTMLSRPSAFDRINVRRLFIVLEKAIAIAAKYQLFEFNDAFTRAQFKSLVEPFLRDVQGRRGIIDFRVKCDETNNTGEVIDRNEFIADIFIKPARSINFITLNFIAARTAVSFEEIGA